MGEDLIKNDLSRVLVEMKEKGEITDWYIELNAITNRYRIWFKRSNGMCEAYNNIDSLEKLRESIKYHCAGMRNYMCFLCNNYMYKKRGCRKGKFANLTETACHDFAWMTRQIEDNQLLQALKEIEHTFKARSSKPFINADIHKEMDAVIREILSSLGYDKVISEIPYKKFCYDGENLDSLYIEPNSMSPFQCLRCRNFSILNQNCSWGYDEGWQQNNKCEYYLQGEFPIGQDDLLYFVDGLLSESWDFKTDTPDSPDDISIETIHWTFDRLLAEVLRSLGYFKSADYYDNYEKHYCDIPF